MHEYLTKDGTWSTKYADAVMFDLQKAAKISLTYSDAGLMADATNDWMVIRCRNYKDVKRRLL